MSSDPISDCKWAKKISANNLVTIQTAQEAVKAGYGACKVCKPLTKE